MQTTAFRSILLEFILWRAKGMWAKHEHIDGQIVETDKWYNTYRYSVMRNPLTTDELLNLFEKETGIKIP